MRLVRTPVRMVATTRERMKGRIWTPLSMAESFLMA